MASPFRSPNPPIPTAAPSFQTWNEYLDSLPEWEKTIISDAIVHDPIALRRALSRFSNDPILVVSDGSCKDSYGAFGWELVSNLETLASCYASLSGKQLTPLRSECFGILSWAVFLLRYCEYHTISPISAKIQPYSDSVQAIKYTTMTPHASYSFKPLRADFDVTVSLSFIFEQLQLKIPMIFPITHIKSHTKDYADSPPTLLLHNIDILTKSRRELHLASPPINFSHCRAYLERDGNFISTNEINICRWSWRNAVLYQFYVDKFRIEHPQVLSINWVGYSKAISAMNPAMKRFSVKLSIRWLPVGIRLKYYGNEIDVCHLCPARETPLHLFQCSHRIPFFHDRHSAFCTFLESIATPIDIIAPLSNGILFWAISANVIRTEAARLALSPEILRCVQRQDSAGWYLATIGIMDQSWSASIPDPRRLNLGDKWQAKVSTWLITQAHSLWTTRNTERHEPDPLILLRASLLETEAQVSRVYQTLARLPAPDRHELIRTTIEERLLLPEHTNRLWAAQMLPLLYRRIKYHERHPNNRDIRQFFPVVSPDEREEH